MLGRIFKRHGRSTTSADRIHSERKKVFEYELAHGLITLKEARAKAEEFLADDSPALDARMELFFSYAALVSKQPPALENVHVPAFIALVNELIEQVRKSSDQKRLKNWLFALETELYPIVCLRYYFYDDNGENDTDVDRSCDRFMQASSRILSKYLSASNCFSEALRLDRQCRFRDILDIFSNNNFYDDSFSEFLNSVNEDLVMECALDLICDIQRILLPAVSLESRALDAAGLIEDSWEDEAVGALLERSTRQSPISGKIMPSHSSGKTSARSIPRSADFGSALSKDATSSRIENKITEPTSKRPRVDSTGTEEGIPDVSRGAASHQGGRVKFTPEEDEALRDGVNRHGPQWKRILTDPKYKDIFKSVKQRTAINLKDRWRVLQRL